MTHTPGPWEAKCQTGPTWGVWSKSKKGAVAYCGEEDAKLIAAAPEMVELLEEAIDALYDADEYVLADRIDELLKRIDGEEEPE